MQVERAVQEVYRVQEVWKAGKMAYGKKELATKTNNLI